MPISRFHFPTLSLFFLMILRPPRSTLFPTRRSSDLVDPPAAAAGSYISWDVTALARRFGLTTLRIYRSSCRISLTIFTLDRKSTPSELQSPMYLVCRLLLEKKKSHIE